MRGRRYGRWLATGLVAAAGAGCKTTPPAPTPFGPTPGAAETSQFFGAKSPQPVTGPPEVVVEQPRRKPGDGPMPDTEVAFAAPEVDAAFADGRPATERDYLLDSARQRYQRALTKEPNHKGAMLGLARLYARTGEKDRAVATMQAAVKAYPKDHDLAHRLAATHFKFGDWGGAAEACRAALALDPENRTYHKTLGLCQAQLGQWDEAYASMMRVMPEAQARCFLGKALADMERPDDARQQMQLALRADPEYGAAREFLANLDAAARQVPGGGAEPVRQAGYADPGPGGR